MKNIRDSIKLFRFNITNVILFEIILAAVSFAALIPLYYGIVSFAVKLSGISYLTKETVLKFFRSPSTYVFIVLLLLMIAMYIMVNVAGLSISYHRANYMMKTGPIRMLFFGLKSALRMLRPRNLPMIPFILCFLPVITNVILSFVLLNIRAPYMIDIVSANLYMTIGAVVVYGLLVLISLRYLFVIHIFTTQNKSFRRAIDDSDETLKGHRLTATVSIFLWCVLMIGVPALIQYYYTDAVLDKLISSAVAIKIAGMIYEVVDTIGSLIYIVVGLPLITAFICNIYYNLIPESEDVRSIDDFEEYDAKKSRKTERKILIAIMVVALVLDAGFYVLKRYNVITLNAEYLNKMTVQAHRGDSSGAPENTLAAFDLAIENGADVVELDVRQTKDGEIVIMHDENLKRTCGVNNKVGELTLAELGNINAAAQYRGKNKEQYEFEKIPTLREAIELVGGRARMNIELKPAKTDKNLEKKVAEIIEEYDYYDNCVVASLTYKSIRKIKQADPKVKTIYVMAVAMGDFYDLEYADGFSIKHRFINNEIIKKSHRAGKEVYAWTVDDKETLENMMLLDVDSIITNNPDGIRRDMYENYYGDTLIERLNLIISNQL